MLTIYKVMKREPYESEVKEDAMYLSENDAREHILQVYETMLKDDSYILGWSPKLSVLTLSKVRGWAQTEKETFFGTLPKVEAIYYIEQDEVIC